MQADNEPQARLDERALVGFTVDLREVSSETVTWAALMTRAIAQLRHIGQLMGPMHDQLVELSAEVAELAERLQTAGALPDDEHGA